ncbi:type I secretion C-terminal target domain-containing protein [Shewanella sp. 10N.286.48.B5]|uniref:type I secretion C-terminal target domain-containing protein n=1 Tax=Shewanella sp. 10N.286.48.B5 TaxID=1880834 RepID=UPI0039A6EA69
MDVTAQVIDAAGNASGIATDNQGVDNTDAPTPAVEFAGMGSDGIYSSDEIGADGTVTATVTLNPGTAIGDTLIITDGNGNELFNGLVTQAMLDNGQAIEVAVIDGQTQVDVTAQVIDAAGNASGIATDNQGVDNTDAPTPAVEFAGMGSDGIYSSDEIGADGTVTATVTLNPGTAIGDTLIITDGNGNELFNGLVTQAMLDNGQAIEVAVVDGQTQVDVTAQVIDAAGNASGIATDNQGVDNTDAPTPAVEFAGMGSDGIYSSDEIGADGTVTATVTLNPGTEVGDTLIITDGNGNELFNGLVTQDMLTNGQAIEVAVVDGQTQVDVTAQVIDAAGNASGIATDNQGVDNTDAPTPAVEFAGMGSDGIYSSDEIGADGTVTATVTLNPGTEVGDTLIITDGNGNELFNGLVTQAMLDNGQAIEVAVIDGQTQVDVTAQVIDAAGNASGIATDNQGVDNTDAPTPAVEFAGMGSDGIYSSDEIGADGTVTATVTLNPGTEVGDTLIITDGNGNELFNGLVTQDMLTNGQAIEVAVIDGQTQVDVTAQVIDAAGNASGIATDNQGVDNTDAPTPAVEFAGMGSDGIYSSDEIGADGTVTATVTLNPGTEVGDTLIITDGNGNELFNGLVTQAMLTNGQAIEVAVIDGQTQVDVTAQVIDAAGNASGIATDNQGVDNTDAPTPAVEFEGMGSDGIYSSDEIGADGTVTATVTLNPGTEVGDTLIITDGNGNELFNGLVTQAMLDNGQAIEVAVIDGQTQVDVTAQVIDAAGNASGIATDNQGVDNTDAPTPAVEFAGMGSDGIYSSDEIGADGTVTATVTLAAGTAIGDTLIITDGNGNELFNGLVTQDMLTNGQAIEVAVVDGQTQVDVTAQVIDAAGNASGIATDNQGVDNTDAPTPAVEFAGMGSDGIYSSDEIGADGTVTATVTLNPGTEVGDTLIITDGNGNELFNGLVTQAMLDNGQAIEVAVVDGQTQVDVTAQVIDAAGNASGIATDNQGVDNTDAPTPAVEFEGMGSDGIYSSDEIGADGTVTATVTLNPGTAIGDTLIITDGNGNELFNGLVTQAMLTNGQAIEVAVIDGQTQVDVTAQVIDAAGNASGIATDNQGVDNTDAPTPAVEFAGMGSDGIYSSDEIGADGTVTATVTLNPGTAIGDTLIITDGNGNELFNGLVTQAMLDNGQAIEVAVVDGQTQVDVTAQVIDAAGNASGIATDNQGVDNTDAPTPAVEFEGMGSDGIYSSDEIGADGTVTATVTLNPGTAIGDTLIITDGNGNELFNGLVTQAMLDNGQAIEVAVIDGQTQVDVTAQVIDAAGNASGIATDNQGVDNTDAPTPAVEFAGMGSDGIYSSDEIGADGTVTATVTLNPGTAIGDTLIITDGNGNELFNGLVTQAMLDNGQAIEVAVVDGQTQVDVTAQVIDAAGNASGIATDNQGVDNTDAPTPAVEFEGMGSDGIYSSDEIGADGTVTATVTLNPGTAIGDTLIITDGNGNELFNGLVTQAMLDNGQAIEVAVVDGQTQVDVTAQVIDAAGNASGIATDNQGVDNTDAPTPAVEFAGMGSDGIYSSDEIGADGTVTATVTLNPGTEVGDTLIITDGNGNELFNGLVTQAMLTNGQAIEVAVIDGQTQVDVTAQVIDAAGNASGIATDNQGVDNTDAPTPAVEFAGMGSDGIYSSDEIGADGTVTATVTLNPGTEVGDTLIITDGNGNELFNGLVTQAMLTNGQAIEVAVIDGQTQVDVTAQVIDAAGNASGIATDNQGVDNTDAPTPAVEFEGMGSDGIYSSDEIGADGTVTATVTLNPGSEGGDTLIITDGNGNELFNGLVTQAMLDNGQAIEVAVVDGQTQVDVTAQVIDAAGNASGIATDNQGVDNTDAPTPAVEFAGMGSDGIYSSDEIGADGTVTATVTLNPGTAIGDTLIITDGNGNELFNGLVTQAMLDNGQAIEVAVIDGQTQVDVTAQVIDAAGNASGIATDNQGVDNTDAPTPAVEFAGMGSDGIYSSDEIGADGTVTATVTLNPGTEVGDTLIITDGNGNELFNGLVTQDMLTNGQAIEVAVIDGQTQVDVTAQVIDAAGNASGIATDNQGVDNTDAPTPAVEFEGMGSDGIYSSDEIGADGTVTATVTLNPGTEVGDTLIITDGNGNELFNGLVTQDMLTNGQAIEVAVIDGQTQVDVTAQVIDAAGNASGIATDNQGVDNTDAPTPAVEFEGMGSDGIYSSDEIGADGTVTATVTLNPGTEVGDTLIITDGNGNELFNGLVTQDMLTNGQAIEVAVIDGQTQVDVTAQVIDAAGNASGIATDNQGVDNTDAPTPAVEFAGMGSDGIYSSDEIGADGTVTATVTLNPGTEVGDTLIITDGNGNELFNGLVTQAMLDNGQAIEVAVIDGQTQVDVTAQVIDAAGNASGIATDNQGVDNTDAPTPAVEFAGMGSDGIYSSDEIGADGTVTATVTLNPGTEVGDTLIITDGNGNELFNGLVTQAMLDNGQAIEVAVVDGQTQVDVTAQVIDAAGNASGIATDNQGVDNTDAPTPAVEFEGMGSDGIYSSDEIGADGTVTATVTLAAGTEIGDTLIITDGNGNELFNGLVTQAMLDNGQAIEVAVVDGQTQVDVTAQVIDAAGNASGIATDNQGVDNTDAPTPAVEFEGMGSDGIYSSDEIGADGTVTATVTLNPGTAIGDTLIITDGNGNELFNGLVTQAMLDNGQAIEVAVIDGQTQVDVTAQVIDAAGNASGIATDNQGVDNTDAPTPAVEFAGMGSDGIYSSDEIGADGTVTATVTLNPGTAIGDTLIITDGNGNELFNGLVTQAMLDNGQAIEVAVVDGQTQVDVTAQVIDAAGNASGIATDNQGVDNTGAPTPAVEFEGMGSDGIYSSDEIGADGTVTATVTLNPGTAIGDTLIITDGNGNELFNGLVTQAMLDNGQAIEVAVVDGQTQVDVTAQVIDAAGNASGIATDNQGVDNTDAPTPAVEFAGMGSDGIYSSEEIGADGTVTATVTLNPGTEGGDTLIITDGNGNELFNGLVTQAMLDNGQAIEVAVIDGQTQVDVTAQVIDAAGNASGIATDNQGVDNTDAPTPAVEFAGMGSDGIYSSDEIGADGTVTATVTLAAGTAIGDTLIITDGNGNELFNGLVTQDMLTNGQAIEVAVVDGQTQVDVTAQVIDAAGNASGIATDNQGVDNTDAPTPAVEFAGMGSDGIYSSDEIGADGTVTATVTLNPGTEVGDTLIITDGNGNELFNGLVTQAMLDNGQAIEVAVVDGQTQVDVTAQVIDAAGNASGIATDNQGVDNTDAPTPAVEFAGMGSDGIYSSDEIGADGTVTATVTLNPGTEVGDTLIITDGNGNELFNGLVTQDMLTNGQAIEVAVIDGQTQVDVTAQVIDAAGNASGIATDNQGVDNVAPSRPSIIITDDGTPGDTWLNHNEINANGSGIQIQANVDDADLVAGGYVSITTLVNGSSITFELQLESGQLVNLDSTPPGIDFTYNNGVITWSEDVPAEGQTITVSISQTDAAGNESTLDSDTATINTVDAVDDAVGSTFSTTADSSNGWVSPTNADGEADFVISARNADGSTGTLTYNDGTNQLGVDGSPRSTDQITSQIEYDSASGTSEAIVIDFNGLVNEATFSVSRMFADENSGEQGTWYAYYNGQLVATETFSTTSGTTGTFTINTGNLVFDQLVFEAAPTISEVNGGPDLTDSSDYYLDSVTVTGPALVDAYVVQEDQILTISDITEGLFANDTDAQGHSFSISHVNGSSYTYGQAITLTSGAIVTINADGTYSYDVNGAFDSLTAGELDTDTFTYTITDQYGAVDTATVTINIVGINNNPVSGSDSFSTSESELLTFTTNDLVNNDTDAENETLTISGFAPYASDTSKIDATEAGASFTTTLGGTITINADGTYSYQAPSLVHNAGDVIVDTFYYQVTDGTGNSSWTAITIDVVDTAPTALDDLDSIGFGGTAYGNVITGAGTDGSGIDQLGADAASIISFNFQGTTYSNFDPDGNITIVTDKGILIANQGGSYTYESTQTDTIAESFDYNDLLNSNGISLSGINNVNNLDLTNLGAPGNNIGNNGSRVGVGGNVINGNEAMIIDLGTNDSFTQATIGLNGGTFEATWTAYAADGTTIVATGSTTNNSINIISNTAFQYIVLTSASGNYGLNSLTATSVGDGILVSEEFSYILEDIDGDTSEATLTVNQDSTPIATADSQTVSEAGLVQGTEEGSNSHIATGNLFDNDSGVSASTIIASIEGQSPSDGIITINTTNGTLTVYTEDAVGIRAGDYQYELNNTNNTGTDLLENFNYIIENSSGVTSDANLEITIVDDIPIANDITQNLQTSAEPTTTNLTFVLDVSGSMGNSAGNGKSYLETAVESLTALIKEVDQTGNVNLQIITYSSGTANSGWLLDDIDGAINYLNSLVANGGTNYAAAINTVMDSGDLPTGADQNFVYFISDGVPSSGQEVDTDQQTEWQTYVQDNYDISFGIGIGNASLDELLPIAYPEINGNEEYAIVVDDADDLTTTILNYFDNSTIVGDLGIITGDSTTGVLIGADGGRVDSITLGGATYNYDPANPEQVLTTSFGGTFTIDFETGVYNYFIDVDENILNQQENIDIEILDNDGDSNSLSLVIELDYYAGLDANVNNIITNQADGSTLNIDTAYLTHGDATPSSAAITSVDGGASLSNGVVTVNAANDGDNFNYTLEGNGASDSAEVTVDYQNSTTLTGTHENDIIIANSTNSGGTQAIVNATVRAGDTYNATNQFGFQVAALAAGLSITQIQIDLRAGTDTNAEFDISDTTIAVGSDSVGITDSANDIFAAMTNDNSVLTMNFSNGDFTEGDSFWFAFDTDSLGSDNGSDLAAQAATFTITLSDGSTQTATYISDGQSGSTGQIYVSDSVLDGGAGDDVLIGGSGNDLLIGGEGDDLLIGGLGDDLLIGGEGDDTYTWSANDIGTDTISGFDINADKLDLSDLLQGEDTDTLTDFLSISFADGNTTITIDADDNNSVDQVIVLDGVDLSDNSNYGTTDEGVVISGLLADGALIIDSAADESAAVASNQATGIFQIQSDENIIP